MGKRAKREQRNAERRATAESVRVAAEAARPSRFLAELAVQRCPACRSAEVASIGYGLPRFTPELIADLDARLVVLDGCDIGGDNPAWMCWACKQTWGRLFPTAPDAEQSAPADGGDDTGLS